MHLLSIATKIILAKNKERPKKEHKTTCLSGNFCKKFTETISKDTVHRYGCGSETFGQPCNVSTDGCVKFQGTTTCCCSKNLCNGSSELPTFLSFVTIIIVKLII
ncbi:unnamed protein product [Cylicocyclus nassatus]|uniref:Uncharacterized protein n=1 Tax=Cylicocyclus nassatus TaxID=53992 RepID=A0AA36M549_CYLNA|nr:unnamed protein product [Cylicocyclus nassatus]